MEAKKTDWHGDSQAWGESWIEIGSPDTYGIHEWNGVKIELRVYKDYSTHGAKYLRHYKFKSKQSLL